MKTELLTISLTGGPKLAARLIPGNPTAFYTLAGMGAAALMPGVSDLGQLLQIVEGVFAVTIRPAQRVKNIAAGPWLLEASPTRPLDGAFLFYNGYCVGGVDRDFPNEGYNVTVDQPYDPETDSDARLITKTDNLYNAWAALWAARQSAYISRLGRYSSEAAQ